METQKPIVSLQNITKSFRVEVETQPALVAVSTHFTAGEFCCLIGPSGCGKSTLLRIIARLARADSGQIETQPGTKLAMIFQNFALFPWLTVEDNIGFGLKMLGQEPKKIKRHVHRVLNEMGLQGYEKKHPKELSGGMKQRVGIARALVMEPDVLLMDEPFSALDALTAGRLRTDLLSIWLKEKMTIIMVTHLVEEAVELADRILVFTPRPGEIKATIQNPLPRPRKKRSPEFYHLVDHIQSLISEN